jgi:MoxR-like ATPase
MKVRVGYPSFDDEVAIVELASRGTTTTPVALKRILPISELTELQRQAHLLHVDPKIDRYIVALVHASRNGDTFGLNGLIEWGASPRASIALKLCARALAFIKGKSFVTPDDVKEIAPDVLRHRILPTFEAEARGVDSDEIIRILLASVTVP